MTIYESSLKNIYYNKYKGYNAYILKEYKEKCLNTIKI